MAQEETVVTEALLQEMAAAAAQEVQPEAIILFGSFGMVYPPRPGERAWIRMWIS
jgi:hypothetical protein